MADGIELAKAYVQIVPSAKGFGSKLEGEMKTAGSKSAEKFSLGFSKAAGAITKTTAAGLAAATAAVSTLTAKALEAGSAFETAFAQVQTIMDTTAMSIGDMSSGILNLSNEMGVSTDELSNTVYNVISATGDTANALEIAASAAKLATAGFTDSGSSLSVLTTAMNAYGLAAEDVEHISDSLIMVQNLGVTTVADLSASMGKAIASASAYGVDLENVEAAYVSMTKAGINTAESTTYMSSMMKELGDSGTDAAKLLKEKTGKSFADLMKDGKSLADVLNILYKAEGSNATALMNLWSSAEAGKAANAMLSQGFETFNENLGQIKTTAGVTQTAFETMENTMSSKMDHMKNSWTNLLAGMTMENVDFSGLIDGFVEDFSNVVNMLAPRIPTILNGVVQLISTMIPQLFELLGPVFVENLPILLTAALSVLTSLIQMIATDLPNLMNAILDMLPMIITSLTTALVENLPVFLEGLMQFVLGLVEALPSILQPILDTVEAWLPILIEAAITLLMAIIDAFPTVLNALTEKLPDIIETILTAFIDNFDKVLDGAITLLDAIIQAIPTIVTKLTEKLPDIIDKITEKMDEWLPDVLQGATDLFMEIVKAIPTIVTSLTEKLPDIINKITGKMDEWLPDVLQGAIDLFMEIVNAIPTIITSLTEKLPDIISSITGFLVDHVDDILTAAITMMEGLLSAIPEIVTSLTEKLPDIFNAFVDSLFSPLGLEVDGIKETFQGICDFISGVFSGDWEKAWDGIKGIFSGVWDTFVDIAKAPVNLIIGLLNGLIDGINMGIDGINKISVDVPDWVPLIGGKKFGFNLGHIGKIAYLAEGGVLTSPTLMVGGEDGQEAVVPLDRNTEWIRRVAAELDSERGFSDELLDVVEALSEKLDRMQIVLDGDQLVGGISTRMDRAIGRNAEAMSRGVALA